MALVRCARVAIAAARYRNDSRQAPATLEALVPQYLSALPIDPFSGQALGYERQSDAFAITSVAPIRGPFREVAVRVRLRSIVK